MPITELDGEVQLVTDGCVTRITWGYPLIAQDSASPHKIPCFLRVLHNLQNVSVISILEDFSVAMPWATSLAVD